MLFRFFKLGPPNSVTMQTAVIDGNYFPWEWGLFPSRFLPIPILIPIPILTIDRCLSHSHGIPIPNGNPIPRVTSSLEARANEASEEDLISISPPTLLKVHNAFKKIISEKAPEYAG